MKEIKIQDLQINPFTLFGKDWMALATGNEQDGYNGAFFTPDGRVTDDLPFRGEIYEELKCCAVNNIPRKITNILEVMKLAAHVEDFAPETDKIHLANGTLTLDGNFTEGMVDEWSGFAALLANLIEKYAVVLNLDALPNLVIEESVPEKDEADEMIHENDIEPAKAA